MNSWIHELPLTLTIKEQTEFSRKKRSRAPLFQMHSCLWKKTRRIIFKMSTSLLKPWACFDATREGKNEEGQQQWQLHVSCKLKYIKEQFMSFWVNSKASFYTGNLTVRLRVAVESDCSYRVEENETFELIKISSTLRFRSIGEAIGCFRDISFRLRGSLGEEWNDKRTTHRTRISPSLLFLR